MAAFTREEMSKLWLERLAEIIERSNNGEITIQTASIERGIREIDPADGFRQYEPTAEVTVTFVYTEENLSGAKP